jgi:hypothetical protein
VRARLGAVACLTAVARRRQRAEAVAPPDAPADRPLWLGPGGIARDECGDRGVVAGRVGTGHARTTARRRRSCCARSPRYRAAVAALQAARHGAGLNIAPNHLQAVDAAAEAQAVQELSTEGVRRFLDAAAAARAALAALHVYSPDLRTYWDKFEVTDAELDPLVKLLFERRRRPLKQHS